MNTDYSPKSGRYEEMIYRRCGRSGLNLPVISLGLWHNFGESTSHAIKREMCFAAFDVICMFLLCFDDVLGF